MEDGSLLFLDFDGVIGDSAGECFVSSWYAFHQLIRKESPPQVPARYFRDFLSLRPFVRSGEDFILVQKILHDRTSVACQEDFDALAGNTGHTVMAGYKRFFYEAREEILRQDRSYWLSLNPVYPFMVPIMRRWSRHPRLYILSTKRPEFIDEILRHQGMEVEAGRILYAGREAKVVMIERILEGEAGGSAAALVDDQLDHLLQAGGNRIRRYLASWGYVKPEWRDPRPGVTVLDPEDMPGFIDREIGPSIR